MSRWKGERFYYQPTQAIRSDEGIKARNQRGKFAQNWWAQRWITAMERLVDAGRLARGRSYARRGQVLSIEEAGGCIHARVQGSRPTPYKVSIKVRPLNHKQWEKVIDELAEQAIFTAQLLAGEMPQEIEQAFNAAGISLFPAKSGDLKTECSCPDYANPCKHVAATHYILGERFDEDPFMIFRLRGMSQEQVMAALRQRRADGKFENEEEEDKAPEAVIPLEEQVGTFWDFSAPFQNISIAVRPPAIEMPLLKRLGEASFVPEPGLNELLGAAYAAIQKKALEAAYQDIG